MPFAAQTFTPQYSAWCRTVSKGTRGFEWRREPDPVSPQLGGALVPSLETQFKNLSGHQRKRLSFLNCAFEFQYQKYVCENCMDDSLAEKANFCKITFLLSQLASPSFITFLQISMGEDGCQELFKLSKPAQAASVASLHPSTDWNIFGTTGTQPSFARMPACQEHPTFQHHCR